MGASVSSGAQSGLVGVVCSSEEDKLLLSLSLRAEDEGSWVASFNLGGDSWWFVFWGAIMTVSSGLLGVFWSFGTAGVMDCCRAVLLRVVDSESALKTGSDPPLSWISWYRSSIGAPLLSDAVTPSCRRWRRAWLERPRRVSKYDPQASHITGCVDAVDCWAAAVNESWSTSSIWDE